ncbi:MAG: hypothetical protein II938_04325 [Alphaproteobacteria bacterium]|nr:hypothetical protein [Alphaproteobacteria bacterium]
MREKYFEICDLINELGPLNARLDSVRGIVSKPDFQYKKEEGGDIVAGQFLASSYWLAQELFDESYLYKKTSRLLTASQNAHLKMVDIGVELLNKGFPLQYDPAKYEAVGPGKLAPYVKTFAEQCQKKHALVHNRTPRLSNTIGK